MWGFILGHWQELITGSGGIAVLASLPRVGKYVRWFLLACLRSLPPLAELRVQAANEGAAIERERSLRYRGELDELTAELKRRTADIERLTSEIVVLRNEVASLRVSVVSSAASPASPSPLPPTSATTPS